MTALGSKSRLRSHGIAENNGESACDPLRPLRSPPPSSTRGRIKRQCRCSARLVDLAATVWRLEAVEFFLSRLALSNLGRLAHERREMNMSEGANNKRCIKPLSLFCLSSLSVSLPCLFCPLCLFCPYCPFGPFSFSRRAYYAFKQSGSF
jgi:hypothetical protein